MKESLVNYSHDNFDKKDIEEIIRLYTKEFMSYRDIGKLFNTSRTTIYNMLKDNGVNAQDYVVQYRPCEHKDCDQKVRVTRGMLKTPRTLMCQTHKMFAQKISREAAIIDFNNHLAELLG